MPAAPDRGTIDPLESATHREQTLIEFSSPISATRNSAFIFQVNSQREIGSSKRHQRDVLTALQKVTF